MDLSLEEAKAAFQEGKAVTHRLLTDDEFLCGDTCQDQDGKTVVWSTFAYPVFDYGWSIVQPSNC